MERSDSKDFYVSSIFVSPMCVFFFLIIGQSSNLSSYNLQREIAPILEKLVLMIDLSAKRPHQNCNFPLDILSGILVIQKDVSTINVLT